MKPTAKAADIFALIAALGLLLWFLALFPYLNPIPAVPITLVFALSGRLLGGVDTLGAIAGGIVAFIFCVIYPGGWLFLCLLLVFLLTLVATRIGRQRKLQLDLAEAHSGRSAAQVMANLFVSTAVLVGGSSSRVLGTPIAALIAMAALAEVTADTVSSEIGQAYGGSPLLISSLKRVQIGTDGGVTLVGTFAGISAALVVAVSFAWLFGLGLRAALLITCAATVGTLADSLLGATLERRGFLTNDWVNFLSTVVAAGTAWMLV
jgi:uncharacterized protein (TIGR00297 family)